MDLGIAGKWALVCAASKGLGKGCAQALAREGVNVVITARGAEALEATARRAARARAGGEVRAVAGDITTPAGRAAALAACPQVDILVNNAGGPPPGDFRDWDRDAWIKALDANMLTPIELIKATVDAMAERGFGRIVNITSGAVKAPIDVLGLSNGARSGLTGFVAGLARSRLAARNVTINNLLPGVVRHRPPARDDAGRRPAKTGKTVEAVLDGARAQPIPARRFGTPRSSARSARSCAACTPATSPGRTSCSTAARTRERSSAQAAGVARSASPYADGMSAPQFQHCSNGPSTRSWQPRQTQCRCDRMAQLVEQACARARTPRRRRSRPRAAPGRAAARRRCCSRTCAARSRRCRRSSACRPTAWRWPGSGRW